MKVKGDKSMKVYGGPAYIKKPKDQLKKEYIEMGKSDAGVRSRMKISGYEPPTNWDPEANRGKGATVSPKQAEKRRRKSLRQEELKQPVSLL